MEKYKIISTKEQLYQIGISYDITGLIGILKHKYHTGYYCLEVKHFLHYEEVTNNFDIPQSQLQLIV